MFFKKKKKGGSILNETSYMQDLFGVIAKGYYKPDEIVKLEKDFEEETKHILSNSAVDSTNDDVRDSYSDAVAEHTKKHYEMQKIDYDFANEIFVAQTQAIAEMFEDTNVVLEKLISMYSNKVFKGELHNEKE